MVTTTRAGDSQGGAVEPSPRRKWIYTIAAIAAVALTVLRASGPDREWLQYPQVYDGVAAMFIMSSGFEVVSLVQAWMRGRRGGPAFKIAAARLASRSVNALLGLWLIAPLAGWLLGSPPAVLAMLAAAALVPPLLIRAALLAAVRDTEPDSS